MAQASSDVAPPRAAQHTDQRVPQRCQRLRRLPHMHLARIFPQRDVPHVMLPVFDRPAPTSVYPAPQRRQLLRAHRVGCQTRDRVGHRARDLARFQHHPFTVSAQHLLHPRHVRKSCQVTRTRQAPRLEPAMPFVDRRSAPILATCLIRVQENDQTHAREQTPLRHLKHPLSRAGGAGSKDRG